MQVLIKNHSYFDAKNSLLQNQHEKLRIKAKSMDVILKVNLESEKWMSVAFYGVSDFH